MGVEGMFAVFNSPPPMFAERIVAALPGHHESETTPDSRGLRNRPTRFRALSSSGPGAAEVAFSFKEAPDLRFGVSPEKPPRLQGDQAYLPRETGQRFPKPCVAGSIPAGGTDRLSCSRVIWTCRIVGRDEQLAHDRAFHPMP